MAHTYREPLHPRRLLVRAAVSWAYARVTRIIAGLFAVKTAPMEIPHLRTSRRTRSMLNPWVYSSRSLMHGLERFTCGLRPPCVRPPCVRISDHQFYNDALSMWLPAVLGNRCPFNRNICYRRRSDKHQQEDLSATSDHRSIYPCMHRVEMPFGFNMMLHSACP